MKIHSLIIPTFLALGLSLGLSNAAQARDTHSSIDVRGGDHGYAQQRHSRHHFKHQRRHHNNHGAFCRVQRGYQGRHYGRLDQYHSDRYRKNHRQDRHSWPGRDIDRHDRTRNHHNRS